LQTAPLIIGAAQRVVSAYPGYGIVPGALSKRRRMDGHCVVAHAHTAPITSHINA
jgi:hypothetical protein